MKTTSRAALSIALLAGFYLVAVGIVAVTIALAVQAFALGGEAVGVKLGLLAVVVGLGVGGAVWSASRAPGRDPGPDVTRADAPELWQVVDELATLAETRGPDRIELVSEVNAAVYEDARFLGLVGGPRTLLIGTPLVQGLDVAQLRSVLAHELGHYSGSHTRLAPLTYRGRLAISHTLARLDGKLSGWLLKQYAKLYMLASQGVSRSQELEADALSVRAAGRATAQSALRALPALARAHDHYENTYVRTAWELGFVPTPADYVTGFGDLLRELEPQLAELRAEPPADPTSRWDSHPSIADRIAAISVLPESDATADPRPASDLFADLPTLAAREASVWIEGTGKPTRPWPELTALVATDDLQRRADLVYRAAAHLDGTDGSGLAHVTQLVARGDGPRLVDAVAHDASEEERPEVLVDVLATLLGAAAVTAGTARWTDGFDGQDLVAADGRPFDARPAALALATAQPADAELAALGIDLAAGVQASRTADAQGADILDGLANLRVDGKDHDLLILTTGLLLKPGPKSTDHGKRRLTEWAQSAAPSQLAAEAWHVAYEDVANAEVHKMFPFRMTLSLRDGTQHELRGRVTAEMLTDDVFINLLGALGFEAADAEA
ncbi:M48 family metallopeptidase [Aeromicrobium alkaliterrae]|uniref:Peptidase M48 domain-containing protein n=1 Tax=Aeromicrobium alkaliterrae TaxID=302168 RepID=A0ABN2K216_9ACTN